MSDTENFISPFIKDLNMALLILIFRNFPTSLDKNLPKLHLHQRLFLEILSGRSQISKYSHRAVRQKMKKRKMGNYTIQG